MPLPLLCFWDWGCVCLVGRGTAPNGCSVVLPYERFQAWKLSYQLTLDIYRATSSFPKHELYGLTSQARRAAFSVVANIAEGSAKRGPREFRRYLDIALGSLSELSVTLRLAHDLGLLTADAWGNLEQLRNHAGILVWRLYRAVGKETGGRDHLPPVTAHSRPLPPSTSAAASYTAPTARSACCAVEFPGPE